MTKFDLFSGPLGVPEDVSLMFEKFTFDVIAQGFTHYSADAILHRIRWHFTVEKGLRTWKCNNDHTAKLARWFMWKHPARVGFFTLRRSKYDD